MLGITQIIRLFDQDRHAQVIDGCLRATGQPPLSLRLQFESPDASEAGAAALALKRVTELSYRTTEPIERLAEAVVSHQQDDGSFTRSSNAAVTLAALAGLSAFLTLAERSMTHRASGPVLVRLVERARDAFDRGVAHVRLLAAVSEDGLVADETTTAYALLISARDARLRGAIDPGWLARALRDCGGRHHRHAGPMMRHAERLLDIADRSRTPNAA